VFTPGSSALRRDQQSLRAYAERHLTVHGVSMEFDRVSVLDQGKGWVRLLVVDRLGVVDVVRAGGQAVALPRDNPTRHRMVLRQRPAGPGIGWPQHRRWLIDRIDLA
jgi:hypothetical protein